MSPAFRGARPDDVPAAARLAAHSFPAVGRSNAEWQHALTEDARGGLDALWVGEDAGELTSMCRLFRFRQWIGGALFPVMGLGTVAIAPTHRRRGLAARLLISGYHHAVERGDVASVLYPFRTSFYQRLGYAMAGDALQYQLPPPAFPDAPERERVRMVSDEQGRTRVRSVYDAWAPKQTGQMQRGESAWEPVWEGESRGGVWYEGSGGQSEGYAVFRYHPVLPRGGRTVEVEEIAWLTPDARRGLQGWLSSLGDQWDTVVYRAHPDEGFAERLGELRYPVMDSPRWHFWFAAAAVLQGPMFRLLDIAGAWERRAVTAGSVMTLALDVHDEQLATNSGRWRLRLEGGRAEVQRGAEGSSDVTLRLDIATLSRLFVGSLTPSAAVAAELAAADRPECLADLDRALRLPRPWTFDRF